MSGFTQAEMEETKIDPYEETPKYARGVVYFVCAVIVLSAASRSVLALRRRFARIYTRSSVYRKSTAAGRFLASKQQRLFGYHFPTLGVTLLILAFFAFTMIWTWATLPYYRSRWNVGGSPLAMRSGFMALACFPFIFAFASKWNFVTFITGHSHEKLQVYHQFMSHIFLILSFIHSFPWLVQGMKEVKPGFEPLTQIEWSWHVAHKVYYWTGAALLIILAWLCWASLPSIRNRYYETFKYLHVISAILFTVFFFIHCNKLLGSWEYLYATVVIYGASAICRFGWMLYSNTTGMPTATLELMPAGIMKLRIRCNPLETWKPGQHYFIHFATLMPFQSHPFTISNIPQVEGGEDRPQELVVLIRQANGFTKKLARYLVRKVEAQGETKKVTSMTIPLLLDGPYGGVSQDLSIYEHVLLVAGGTGITFVMPVLQDLIRKMNINPSLTVCKSVQMLWSVRAQESISWMINELQEAVKVAPPGSITIKIHVTGDEMNNSSNDLESSEVKEAPESSNVDASPALSYPLFGRADIPSVVRAAGMGTLGIAACGPQSLLYDVRNAVASLQKDILLSESGCVEVYLHSEEYGW
ncbi:hypothetical protein L218DRAFT_942341 [Marasmius fiardii PR-910]|nr:hypothetical protein L218DRAFT_942341 [Marasmius fiardii PR-910]